MLLPSVLAVFKFPKLRLGLVSSPPTQRGLVAMSSAFLRVKRGGTDKPFLISWWRCPCICRSAVSINAEHSAALARSINSLTKPRSRITYS